MSHLSINDLDIYRETMEFGETMWSLVGDWDYFAKDTVGKQLVRCADSIAANISEGHGRFHFNENKQFCYYAKGSMQETQTFIEKASRRKLITTEEGCDYYTQPEQLMMRLNAYINSIGNK